MPKIPASGAQVVPMAKPPEEVYFAMAAAQMDRQGRLFQPEPDPLDKPEPKDYTNQSLPELHVKEDNQPIKNRRTEGVGERVD